MAPPPSTLRLPTLAAQIAILAACAWVVWALVRPFPYPSALISRLLPPQKRWPTQQIREQVAAGDIDEGFLSFFMRDPERTIPPGDVVVAAADGVLVDMPVRDGKRWYVVGLSFWDVHVQRAPIGGVVRAVEDRGDTFMDKEWRDLVFVRDKQSPVQKVVTIDTEFGEV